LIENRNLDFLDSHQISVIRQQRGRAGVDRGRGLQRILCDGLSTVSSTCEGFVSAFPENSFEALVR
jgi:hypothetical protein